MKQFEDAPLLRRTAAIGGTGAFTTSDAEEYGPIRNKIREAAVQLKGLAGRGVPLVVVLVNPRGLPIHLNAQHVGYAMYGNPTFGGPFNPETGVVEHMGAVQGRDGKLTNDHQYVSAVVLLHRRSHATDAHCAWREANRDRFKPLDDPANLVAMLDELDAIEMPDGDYLFVDVVHTTPARTGDAPLLPPKLFNGPRDRHWVIEPNGICQRGENE